MRNKVYEFVEKLLKDVEETQHSQVEQVALAVADAIECGGLLQAFGAGHSYGGALELTHRAGGFIPSKNIKEPALGAYESVEGVGTTFMKKVDIRPNDIVFVISNSGRNPLPIEVALAAKAKGAKVVAVTSLEASKKLKSKHSSGKNLYEVVDYILDNRVPEGDSCVEVPGMDVKVCGMSSISTAVVLEAVVLRAVELLLERGIVPPIYKSQNIDGGREYNEAIEKDYIERLYRV
ncbi:MAG: sugar isomerase domain-containing protein [Erysipelotrichaceae bacterium]|nr:sugar isomerase domain-containing protein [Erysipelotrichaceae bacterium]